MKTVVFDLETIADPSVIPLLPKVEASKNLKDPVKIAADLEKKKAAQIAGMGLNPSQLLICCASFLDLETDKMTSIMLNPETLNERELLIEVWEYLHNYERFVTFNGINFDVEALKFRSLINKVYPSVIISQQRYRMENHVDVRMVLGQWDKYCKGDLDYYSKIILGPEAGGKTEGVTGADVQPMWDKGEYDKIREYCERDVRILAQVYERLIGYYI